MKAVFGFLGEGLGFVLGALAIAAGLTFLVLAWKAGILDELAQGGLLVLKGLFVDVPLGILGFLGDLLTFAAS